LSTHRMSALAAGTSLAIATATGGAGGAADDPGTSDPWVTLTEDGYHRFAVPHSAVREALGAEPVTVEVSGTFGPAGTWADLATELQGGEHVASTLLTPGLHVFTYTATLVDRTRVTFREPTQPQPVTSDDTLATIFVAGEGVDWFADSPEPGPVEEVTYRVGESDRTAFVWRPHGVSGALPTLFLLADEAHSAREWLELGRAAQVLDRLHTDGGLTPMQVVMARVDDAAEVTRDLAPALGVELTDGAPALAAAGIGTGAAHALELARDTRLAALGLMSARLDGARPGLSAEDAPDLVRVYVGNSLDPAYDPTLELLATLDGVPHEFDGVTPGSGGTWDTWRSALRDLASRAFQDAVVGGPREGHPLLEAPYSPPEDVTTPHVDEHGIVTFVTGTQWAEAHEVRVWGNWAPHGAWYRIPMERDGDRWRLRIGPLDGFYYYRYVVDGVDVKDPADTVTWLTGVSPLFVPGETDLLLADAAGDQLGVLTAVVEHDNLVLARGHGRRYRRGADGLGARRPRRSGGHHAAAGPSRAGHLLDQRRIGGGRAGAVDDAVGRGRGLRGRLGAHADRLVALELLALRLQRRGDHHLGAVEGRDVLVAAGRHRGPQAAHQVEGAVVLVGGAEQDLLERAVLGRLDAGAARQVGMEGRHPPVVAVSGRLVGARER